jgi:hypothetical protein
MWLFSQRHISNPMRGSSFQIMTPVGVTVSRNGKIWGTAFRFEETFPVVSTEATRGYRPTGNSEVLLAAVYTSPGHAWSDANISEFLSLRRKSLLEERMKAKCSFGDSLVTNAP